MQHDLDLIEMQPSRRQYFTEWIDGTHVALGCSDERGLTDASLILIDKLTPEAERHFFRLYGGIFGILHIFAAYSQFKNKSPAGQDNLLEDPDALLVKLRQGLDKQGIIATVHSDTNNEESTVYDANKDSPLGCAFAANISLVVQHTDDRFVQQMTFDIISEFGGDTSKLGAIAGRGQQIVSSLFASTPSITKKEYRDMDCPVLMQEGGHLPAEQTALVLNYSNMLSMPISGVDGFYVQDVAIAAKAIAQSFPEKQFDVEELFSLAELQAVATATILASRTRTDENTKILPIEYLGDRKEAIALLKSQVSNLY